MSVRVARFVGWGALAVMVAGVVGAVAMAATGGT